MDNSSDFGIENLVKELSQGRKHAKQLQLHLSLPSLSHETHEFLVNKILSSYENALSMLNYDGAGVIAVQPTGTTIGRFDSPRSHAESLHSDDSDRELKDQDHKETSKKRKPMPRWTHKVQVCPGDTIEGQLDDGYTWRKYGQKDILGAKYPRGYYRCTYRHAQDCLATKQVQRSDDDPTLFEITYKGKHSCTIGSTSSNEQKVMQEQQEEPKLTENLPHLAHQTYPTELLLNFQTGLRVTTPSLDTNNEFLNQFNQPALSSSLNQDYVIPHATMNDASQVGNHSHSFVSSETSAFLHSLMNNNGGDYTVHGSEDELARMPSTTNPSAVGQEFPFGPTDFGPNFPFGNPGYFP